MERISILLFLSCSLVAAIRAGELETCARNYMRVGCFTDKSDQSKSMLVYDRYGIQWKNIKAYIHNLACRCEKEARKDKKYAGFAIHFWGECYGKTQAQLDAVHGKTESLECTGDEKYSGCAPDAKECAGHAWTDFYYKLEPKKDAVNIITDCNDEGVNVTCPGSSKIEISKLLYGQRTSSNCGAPISADWESKCAYVGASASTYVTESCNGKSHCVIKGWKSDTASLCPKMPKYLEISYMCKS